MRYLLLSLLLFCGSVAYAADPPLPPEAQKVLDDLDAAVAKLKAKAAADLQKVQDKVTKAGNLDQAMAIKKTVEGLREAKPIVAEVGFKNDKEVIAFLVKKSKWQMGGNKIAVFDAKQLRAVFLEGGKETYNTNIRVEKGVVWMGTCKFDFSKSDGNTALFYWPGGESETVTLIVD